MKVSENLLRIPVACPQEVNNLLHGPSAQVDHLIKLKLPVIQKTHKSNCIKFDI